jgi:hypothetical protein
VAALGFRPTVSGVSCAAGFASRSWSGAAAAGKKLGQGLAICSRRDAVTLALQKAARLPGQRRAAAASHRSWTEPRDMGNVTA